MGLLDRFKKTAARQEKPPRNTEPQEKGPGGKTPAGGYLVFDNLPFKLAVVQKLMYEQQLLGEKYRGGDAYFERYDDVEEVSDEESLARLKPYITQGSAFFHGLNIPASMAGEITELYVGEELEIYFQINPQWLDFDGHFEKDFDITAVSEREVRQFPNLRSVTFDMYHTPPERLVEQLRGFGLEVTVAE